MTKFEIDAANESDSFSKLPWHDSAIVGVELGYTQSDETLLRLRVIFNDPDEIAEVSFIGARAVRIDIDLLAKKLCGDQVASAYCVLASESATSLIERVRSTFDLYRGETLDGLYAFVISLIHPAGDLVVLAKSFSILRSRERRVTD